MTSATVLQFPAKKIAAVAPAMLVCDDCKRYVPSDPEATLAHLIACDAGDTTLTRDEAIKRIRQGLRKRSGKAWSVRGGRGTAWGWIDVSAPPARLVSGSMTEADRLELGQLLGTDVNGQGASIAASNDHYAEYVARAEGREPTLFGKQYWD